jgi:phage shock protein A
MTRRVTDAAMQQADHDLLIQIATRLEQLTLTTKDYHTSTQAALAAKAERTDVEQLRGRIDEVDRTTPSLDAHHSLAVTADALVKQVARLERITWIAFGGIITIEVLFKYVIPALQYAKQINTP